MVHAHYARGHELAMAVGHAHRADVFPSVNMQFESPCRRVSPQSGTCRCAHHYGVISGLQLAAALDLHQAEATARHRKLTPPRWQRVGWIPPPAATRGVAPTAIAHPLGRRIVRDEPATASS